MQNDLFHPDGLVYAYWRRHHTAVCNSYQSLGNLCPGTTMPVYPVAWVNLGTVLNISANLFHVYNPRSLRGIALPYQPMMLK